MPTTPLRIIFAGTPDFSVPALDALQQSEHEVVAVYTQPDRPAGRGRKLTSSPVKAYALEHNLAIMQPATLKTAAVQETLAAYQADVMVVVAYGLILPLEVLQTPALGCLNIHASLLPRWRGAAPIQRAIEAGDKHTGVTIMQMDAGLDTGAMLTTAETPIHEDDSAQTLHDRLSHMGSQALLKTLRGLQTNTITPQTQDANGATYAKKLSKAEAVIDWTQSAPTVQRKIQAFNPWPMAFSHLNKQPIRLLTAAIQDLNEIDEPSQLRLSHSQPGEIIGLQKQGLLVATEDGLLLIKTLQAAGKKAMNAYDFAQSRDLIGQTLV